MNKAQIFSSINVRNLEKLARESLLVSNKYFSDYVTSREMFAQVDVCSKTYGKWRR